MAQAASAAAGAAAGVQAAMPLIEKAIEMANTELVGYHKTTFKYDSAGKLKETHTWNASLKAWEAAFLIGAGVLWETAIVIGDAVKGGTEAATFFFDPIDAWVHEALVLIAAGKPTSAPPSKTAGQALNAQLALMIHAVGQVIDPLIMPTSDKLARGAQNYVNKATH